ncbi:MAG: tRNA (adenosine(37)-N6)-threonylcarbamoyltransferase complex transferase subunit TsaD [Clostridia bacterium]|nr:tRNA (adenosine(37)-N6)-threonylcarbamoyltransferase complex transferase subunit TsaD [Clostridia bacterium]
MYGNFQTKNEPVILGLESSCDETAAAIVRGRSLICSEIISSATEQAKFGGVVPEIASRAHTDAVDEVTRRALSSAHMTVRDLDAVAVTYGAGLLGALLVGLSFAKTLAYSLNVPLIAVNHIRGHMAAAYLTDPEIRPPYITLLASGGHTAILHTKTELDSAVLGGTCDDAAGEAFDKVARTLGLEYPGGVNIERLARSGRPCIKFPSPLIRRDGGFAFSYSGLKTAVLNYVHNAEQRGEEINLADVACSFQHAAVDPLAEQAVRCAKKLGVRTIVAGGGVVANGYLRSQLSSLCNANNLRLILPEKKFCTDNAAMIAEEGYTQYRHGNFSSMDVNARAQIPL